MMRRFLMSLLLMGLFLGGVVGCKEEKKPQVDTGNAQDLKPMGGNKGSNAVKINRE